MLIVKKFYAEELRRFRVRFFKIFLFVLIIFVLTSILSHVFLVKNPDQAQRKIGELKKMLLERIPLHTTGFKLFLAIFLNNLRTSFFSIAVGLFPFLFLPVLAIFRNGIFLGAVTAFSHLSGMKVYEVLLFYIVPHGIFEFPAMLYSVSLGVFLSFQVSKKILRGGHTSMPTLAVQDRRSEESLFIHLRGIFRTWLSVIVPLLLGGAIVEALLTPL